MNRTKSGLPRPGIRQALTSFADRQLNQNLGPPIQMFRWYTLGGIPHTGRNLEGSWMNLCLAEKQTKHAGFPYRSG